MITQQEHIQNLIANAYRREIEVYQYQLNIDNYTLMLQSLSNEPLPAELQQYAASSMDQLPDILTDEQVETIANAQYYSQLTKLLRSEKVEQSKTQRILNTLKFQIGEDYSTLLEEYKTSQQQP